MQKRDNSKVEGTRQEDKGIDSGKGAREKW